MATLEIIRESEAPTEVGKGKRGRGRPPLTEAVKAERADAKAAERLANPPNPRGRPSFTAEQKAETAKARLVSIAAESFSHLDYTIVNGVPVFKTLFGKLVKVKS